MWNVCLINIRRVRNTQVIFGLFGIYIYAYNDVMFYNLYLAARSRGNLSPEQRPRKSSRDRSWMAIPPRALALKIKYVH